MSVKGNVYVDEKPTSKTKKVTEVLDNFDRAIRIATVGCGTNESMILFITNHDVMNRGSTTTSCPLGAKMSCKSSKRWKKGLVCLAGK
jgi:hypothetical protein